MLLTQHALQRMAQLGISDATLDKTLSYGRLIQSGGARIIYLGQREIEAAQRKGIDLLGAAGTEVVCSSDGVRILTVYRSKRPWRPSRSRRRWRTRHARR